MQELESFEVKTTAAGNTVLDARATKHHADLAVAAAIALYHSNVGAGFMREAAIAGYWGKRAANACLVLEEGRT